METQSAHGIVVLTYICCELVKIMILGSLWNTANIHVYFFQWIRPPRIRSLIRQTVIYLLYKLLNGISNRTLNFLTKLIHSMKLRAWKGRRNSYFLFRSEALASTFRLMLSFVTTASLRYVIFSKNWETLVCIIWRLVKNCFSDVLSPCGVKNQHQMIYVIHKDLTNTRG